MAIGSPRGKNGMRPVYCYDPTAGRKLYVGSAATLEEAQRLELLTKQRVGGRSRRSGSSAGWREVLSDHEREACERAIEAGEQLVYFVQGIDGGPIKIGIAVDPDERLRELSGQAKEAEIHARFRHERLWGEWFEPEFEVVEFARAKHLFGRDGAKLPVDRLRAERSAWRKRTEELETLITTVQRELADALRLRMIDVDEVEAA
jgi:hypothetical protein